MWAEIKEKAQVAVQKEFNTAILTKNGQSMLAHEDQFRLRRELEDIEMEGEPGAKERDQDYHQELESEGGERMCASSDNEEHEEENPVRPRSPIKRNLGNHHETSCTPPGMVCRSSRSKSIKPLRFWEMW